MRHHTNWLKSFVDFASFGEAPLSFYFWTGVATIAGALRRHVWVDQVNFQWVPNFYIILVAPPGVISKTTTIDVGINLLREVPKIHFGPQVVTWQQLALKMGKSLEMFKIDESGLLYPMSAITIAAGELGNFLNPRDQEMVNVLISLWDGRRGVFDKETKTQGNDEIENPYINLIGCTTPAWIQDNFTESMISGGFTSRCIFLYADQKRELTAYPARKVPAGYEEARRNLISDLVHISTHLLGPYSMTEEAYAWGDEWYEAHNRDRPKSIDSDRLGGYFARKQTHIHKLAIILAAAQRDTLIITKPDLQIADQIITSLEKDMPRVFDRIGTSKESQGQAQLVNMVQAVGQVPERELYRNLFRFMGFDDYLKAKNSAIAAGLVEQVSDGQTLFIKAKYEH